MTGVQTCALPISLGEVSDSVVPPSVVGYAKQTPYPYDLARAQQLLKEAGFQPGTPIEIITAQILSRPLLAQILKQDLDKLGFNATIRLMDQPALTSKMSAVSDPSPWQLAIIASGVQYPDAESPLLRFGHSRNHPPAGQNWLRYKNSEFDRLMERQAATSDSEERDKLLAQAQRVMWDDIPWYPLVRFLVAGAAAKSLHGAVMLPSENRIVLSRAWLSL